MNYLFPIIWSAIVFFVAIVLIVWSRRPSVSVTVIETVPDLPVHTSSGPQLITEIKIVTHRNSSVSNLYAFFVNNSDRVSFFLSEKQLEAAGLNYITTLDDLIGKEMYVEFYEVGSILPNGERVIVKDHKIVRSFALPVNKEFIRKRMEEESRDYVLGMRGTPPTS